MWKGHYEWTINSVYRVKWPSSLSVPDSAVPDPIFPRVVVRMSGLERHLSGPLGNGTGNYEHLYSTYIKYNMQEQDIVI